MVERLAELPGVGADPADGVVGQVQLLQRQEPVEPALTHLRQVVVLQLPAIHTNTHTHTNVLAQNVPVKNFTHTYSYTLFIHREPLHKKIHFVRPLRN